MKNDDEEEEEDDDDDELFKWFITKALNQVDDQRFERRIRKIQWDTIKVSQ